MSRQGYEQKHDADPDFHNACGSDVETGSGGMST
jgi:hypothetical protein